MGPRGRDPGHKCRHWPGVRVQLSTHSDRREGSSSPVAGQVLWKVRERRSRFITESETRQEA
jgi:hypothetical protein